VDAWRSTGAARLTDGNGEPTARTACLARLLEASARIGELPPHAVIAAEFAAEVPIPHWVAVEIARSDADGVVTPSASARWLDARVA
jgi:hypothetical protein